MKYLIMFLLSFQASANVSCYTYGSITNCTDGSSVLDFGNMKQIISPTQGQTTVYQYGNSTQFISPTRPYQPSYGSGLRNLAPQQSLNPLLSR